MNDPKKPSNPTTPSQPTNPSPPTTPSQGNDQPNPHVRPAEGPRIPQESDYSPPRATERRPTNAPAPLEEDD